MSRTTLPVALDGERPDARPDELQSLLEP
jgi:hypothetical protein